MAFLRNADRLFIVDGYTFTLVSGAQARFCTSDIPVVMGGNTFAANSLIIEGLKMRLAIGVRVDEQDVKISAHPLDTLAGAQFLSGIADGLLDGATLERDRGYWNQPDDALTNEPVVFVRMFYGLVSTITKAGRTTVELKVKSPLSLLNLELPRNYWSPTCVWTLYDAGCALSKVSFSANVTIGGTPSPTALAIVGGVPAASGADGIPAYAAGRMQFTSGVLNNLNISLDTNDNASVFPRVPLKKLPAAGDTAVISFGCSKLFTTCDVKFANKANFRGFDLVPPVSFSV